MACYDWYIIKVMSIVDSCENDITLSTICYVSNCKNWENYYVPSVYFVTILTYLTHMIDLKIWHLLYDRCYFSSNQNTNWILV